jgi:hypothetical protein
MFSGTISSYPERGKGGNARYRGNCAPQFIADYLATFNPLKGLTIDPMAGSDTTGDVCREMGIPYKGFDLKHGFDSRTMCLRDQLEEPATAAFLHPPYAGLVRYSRDVWGNGEEHPADLSCFDTNIDGFLEALNDVLYNVFDSLKTGGTYGVLLGLWRHPITKELVNLPARLFPYAPGTFVNEVIKAQHNTMSGNRNYGYRPFVLTTHETFYVFRKTNNSLVGQMVRSYNHAAQIKNGTWRNLVRAAIRAKQYFTVDEIDKALKQIQTTNRNVRAQIRKQLQDLVRAGEIVRTSPGAFAAAA